MAENGTLPAMGDGNSNAEHGIPDIGDILANSPVMKMLREESLPEDDSVPAPDDSQGLDDVPNLDDGDGNAKDKTKGDDTEDEGEGTEDSTDTRKTGDLPSEDDIDWEYKVPVKINGKEEHFTLEELRKGYATQQSLSAKGRELGELRKQLDTEREEKLKEVVHLGTALHGQLEAEERSLADSYHTIKEKMEKAIEDGDGYEAKELKSQLTEVQKKYWSARERKEELSKQVGSQVEAAQQVEQERQLAYFNEHIKTVLPKFDRDMAGQIREFALGEGVPSQLLDQLFDPHVIKFINDYRVLKTKTSTGAEKRKAAPVAANVPTRKGTPEKVKKQQADSQLRGRVLGGESSKDDQLSFLKGISKIGSKLR